jgi:phage terminase Nu1 subunit (DNA packaging protein)
MISPRRVQQLTAQGIIPREEHGRYLLAPAIQGYVKFLRQHNASDGGQATNDLGRDKARLMKSKADMGEMEAAQARGDLVHRDDVRRADADRLARMRAKLLELPARCAVRGAEMSDPRTIVAVLTEEVHGALDEMCDLLVKIAIQQADDFAARRAQEEADKAEEVAENVDE